MALTPLQSLQNIFLAMARLKAEPTSPEHLSSFSESLSQLRETEPNLYQKAVGERPSSPEEMIRQLESLLPRNDWYFEKPSSKGTTFTFRPTHIRPRPQYIPISIHGNSRVAEKTIDSDPPELAHPYLAEEVLLRHAVADSSPDRLITIASHAANGSMESLIKDIAHDLEERGRRLAYFNQDSTDQEVLAEFRSADAASVIVIDQITSRPAQNREEFLDVLSEYLNDPGVTGRKVVLISGQRGTSQGQMRALRYLTRNIDEKRFVVLDERRREIVFAARPLNVIQAHRFLTQQAVNLSAKDADLYAQFVLDRVEGYPGLLQDYRLPADVDDYEGALTFFIERFRDEGRVRDLLVGLQILAIDHNEELVSKLLSGLHFYADRKGSIPYFFNDLPVLTRHVARDAAYSLDQADQLQKAKTPLFKAHLERQDPHHKKFQPPDPARLKALQETYPEITDERLRECYEEACRTRIRSERILEDKRFKFAICDPGHEIHGAFAALALSHVVNPEAFAISPHYRSGSVVGMWYRLRGRDDFHLSYLRQQFSKETDPWGMGRQTASHMDGPDVNITPGQSAVGMNIDKAIGTARYLQEKHKDAVVYVEFGNGTESTNNFWGAWVGGNLMGLEDKLGFKTLPIVMVEVDNGMAISTDSQDGQAIRKKAAFAEAMGAKFFTFDANDPADVYATIREAVTWSKNNQKPVFVWGQNFSRPNHHSSATPKPYDLSQPDPLLYCGENLVALRVYQEDDIMRRQVLENSQAKSFFSHHLLGRVGEESYQYIDRIWAQVEAEPEPKEESVFKYIRPPFPETKESPTEPRETAVIMKGAYRAAYDVSLEKNEHIILLGEDEAVMGGVQKVTAGLWRRHYKKVIDTAINEKHILGSATGYALNRGAKAIPCMQFSDYVFDGEDWLVYIDRLEWMLAGARHLGLKLRLPVNPLPLGGGANFHSTMMERFFNPLRGWVAIAPSTSADAYGMTLTAINDYEGPVAIFEQKGIYPTAIGQAIPGEPTDPKQIEIFKSLVANRNLIPSLDPNFRVPLGKAAIRREGKDVTFLGWGQSMIHTLAAAERLHKEEGISAEVLDLRTIIPWDRDAVFESVSKTRNLLIVHDDHVTGSLGESIHSQVHRKMQTDVRRIEIVGAEDVPAIPQNPKLEKFVTVNAQKVFDKAMRVLG